MFALKVFAGGDWKRLLLALAKKSDSLQTNTVRESRYKEL
jgi:hypothetical protein